MHNFHDKLIEVRDRVQRAAERANRDPETVRILAVSKTQAASRIAEAVAAGQHCFGENYVQEALEKQHALRELNIEWHFIGPIQSNKTRVIAAGFDWVHSLDRFKIAERLSQQRPSSLAPLQACIQINIDHENTKSGVQVADLPDLARAVIGLPHIQLTGLMAIPLPRSDYEAQLSSFRQVADLRQALEQTLSHPLPTLSMGMSGDLEAAIAAGSTLVRIGTDLFGQRIK
jgi:hypothetical protein